jgi:hypothetical protein
MGQPTKSFSIVLMVLVMIGTAGLTIAAYNYQNDALFIAGFPCIICGLLITGGHDGTSFQEAITKVVAVLVNMAIIALPFLLFFYRRSKRVALRIATEAAERGNNA